MKMAFDTLGTISDNCEFLRVLASPAKSLEFLRTLRILANCEAVKPLVEHRDVQMPTSGDVH